jgi:hypothetical protein
VFICVHSWLVPFQNVHPRRYLLTARNELVRDFYRRIRFTLTSGNETCREFALMFENFDDLILRPLEVG